jgi:biopolymer transport protein ExbD
MNFRRGRGSDVPEINLIPLIDVLLVIIIFLMLTTTYAKFSGLEINLPTADASRRRDAERDQRRPDGDRAGAGEQGAAGGGQRAGDQRSPAARRRRHRATGDRDQCRRQGQLSERRRHHAGGAAAGYPRISFATQSPP